MCTYSPHFQFLTFGSALWLPWRPLQPEIHYDWRFEFVDCDFSQQLFCHWVGKGETDASEMHLNFSAIVIIIWEVCVYPVPSGLQRKARKSIVNRCLCKYCICQQISLSNLGKFFCITWTSTWSKMEKSYFILQLLLEINVLLINCTFLGCKNGTCSTARGSLRYLCLNLAVLLSLVLLVSGADASHGWNRRGQLRHHCSHYHQWPLYWGSTEHHDLFLLHPYPCRKVRNQVHLGPQVCVFFFHVLIIH